MRNSHKYIALPLLLLLVFTSGIACSSKQVTKTDTNTPAIVNSKNAVMDENEFWNIISMFDWKYEGDDDKVLRKAVNYLSQKSNEDIYKFEDILSKLLYDLDGIEYAKNIGEDSYKDENTHFSVDWFLYTRCVVVASGKDYYNKVIKDPEQMPKDMEFESLLYVAHEAYQKKNNAEFDYNSKYNYETFSNKEKWKNQ
jgi:hypothetical protein